MSGRTGHCLQTACCYAARPRWAARGSGLAEALWPRLHLTQSARHVRQTSDQGIAPRLRSRGFCRVAEDAQATREQDFGAGLFGAQAGAAVAQRSRHRRQLVGRSFAIAIGDRQTQRDQTQARTPWMLRRQGLDALRSPCAVQTSRPALSHHLRMAFPSPAAERRACRAANPGHGAARGPQRLSGGSPHEPIAATTGRRGSWRAHAESGKHGTFRKYGQPPIDTPEETSAIPFKKMKPKNEAYNIPRIEKSDCTIK